MILGQSNKNLRQSSSPNLFGKRSVTIKEHESEHLDSPQEIARKSQRFDSGKKSTEKEDTAEKNLDRPAGAKTLIKFTESDEDSDVEPSKNLSKKQVRP